jgi:DDE superfamily endonuclease
VEGHDLGQASRLAAATGAYVCFEDEAGQTLRPPKAKTWAPRGHTPIARVSGKGSGRVSIAGLACYKPGSRSRLFYRARVHRGRKGERRSMSGADYASLVTAAHQHLSAPIILIWDNLNTHSSAAMRRFIEAHPDWLTEARLPAYAPDLNAVEGACANMKTGWATCPPPTWTSSPRSSRTGSKVSSTGQPSSRVSLRRPGSPSNHNPRRPQPSGPCRR